MKDVVFKILSDMLANSPEGSYKRLNPALQSTLVNCIGADLPFQRNTFQRVFDGLRGHYWFGDGNGSHVGEHFYNFACEVNHASAIQSFEAFAKRPGVLWEENSTAPERLHVGKRFTWHGRFLEVTSMREDRLVACDVEASAGEFHGGLTVGAVIGDYNDPHIIVASKRSGKLIDLRAEKFPKQKKTVRRRFIIPFAEIAEYRRTAKKRVKSVIVEIGKCDPKKDGEKLSKEIETQHFRHFELEQINAAFGRRKEEFANSERISAWRAGTNGAWLETRLILLRLSSDRVECSNGNSVSANAVRRALPIVSAYRMQRGVIDMPLDGHRIGRTSREGVRIGCALVPWSEVDYIEGCLNSWQSGSSALPPK